MLLWSLLLTPLLAALAIALLPSSARRAAALLAGFGMLGTLAAALALAPAVFAGELPYARWDWLPAAGLSLSLRLDGLAWLFTLLISGIGALIVLYASQYLADEDPAPRFFSTLMVFAAAMMGIVTAGNVLGLVVFWELTSISSFLLIGYWQQREDARAGARMALTVTGMGGLALLAGMLLLGDIVGSFELDSILASRELIQADPRYPWALGLILLGAFAKSAQFPLHFWLPRAMAAPTPVSAYLHSATMVKAGIFLLARLYPALGGSDAWFYVVSGAGAVTMLWGAYQALYQQDLKGLLAYSTISHLGLITLLLGLCTPLSVVAGVFHILNHATFKASLFMAAGIIDHETGSRDFRQLGGLFRALPITGSLAIVASAAMAGVPLLNGFLSKEMFLVETLSLQRGVVFDWAIPLVALAAATLSVAYSVRFIHDVFFSRPPQDLLKSVHEPPWIMRLPVEALVVLCLAVGLFPALLVGDLLHVGAEAALGGPPPDYKLKVWHGFNLALGMSVFALLVGVGLYFLLNRDLRLHRVERRSRGERVFRAIVGAKIAFARALRGAGESSRLQAYLAWLFLVVLLAGSGPLLLGGFGFGPVPAQPIPPLAWLLWLLGMASLAATVYWHRERLTAVIMISALGLVVSLVFVFLSAPDLALTQILVEMASLLLFLLALRQLPERGLPEHGVARKLRDAAIALGCGVGVGSLMYAVLTRPSRSLSDYYLSTTVPLGGGTNAVNVVIVDYRALDTLGEIAVFGVAALIIHALLQRGLPYDGPPRQGAADRYPLFLALVSRLIWPMSILLSLYLFFRGHNQPGGGFIAGLVLAVGLLLQYLASGRDHVETRLKPDWPTWIAGGLLVALLSGVGAWYFAHPFLTTSTYYALPVIGEVKFATATIFDIGVYLVVFAGAMLALLMLVPRPPRGGLR